MKILKTSAGKILRLSDGKVLLAGKQPTIIKYGLLYNWYVYKDARNIANTGWHIPTFTEASSLSTYLGGDTVAGGKLKETGTTYWTTPNTGATNETNFNGRGNGQRENGGTFVNIKANFTSWVQDYSEEYQYYWLVLYYNSDDFSLSNPNNAKYGGNMRLMKDSTSLSDGQTGTYTGNDGKLYRTICIGTQEWLADNLAETRFRNGDIIPWYGANSANYFTNAEWGALTTAGCCAYSNTLTNVCENFSFPTS